MGAWWCRPCYTYTMSAQVYVYCPLVPDSMRAVADGLLQVVRLTEAGDEVLLGFQPVDVLLNIIQQCFHETARDVIPH